jgi:uncharacterized alpha-E superfamily protein
MPRSLLACINEITEILGQLRGTAPCTLLAGQARDQMQRNRIDGILRSGLPQFLNSFIVRNNELHTMIGREFMLVL